MNAGVEMIHNNCMQEATNVEIMINISIIIV